MDDRALYRVALPGGPRLALGPSSAGPECLLPPQMTLDGLLSGSAGQFWRDIEQAPTTTLTAPVQVLAPIETQEVWAAGVTYAPSRDARKLESPAMARSTRPYSPPSARSSSTRARARGFGVPEET